MKILIRFESLNFRSILINKNVHKHLECDILVWVIPKNFARIVQTDAMEFLFVGKKNAPVLNSKTFQRVTCNGLWKKSAKPAHSFMIWCVISSDFVARLKMLVKYIFGHFFQRTLFDEREKAKNLIAYIFVGKIKHHTSIWKKKHVA